MRINKDLAVSTSRILLVPYDAHHVGWYHEWMQDEDLREATASDLLTLEEEYENQQSWRTAHDKLTFIVCQPVIAATRTASTPTLPTYSSADVYSNTASFSVIYAGEHDAEPRMVGDVNLFLTPDDDDDDNNDGKEEGRSNSGVHLVKGEIDIMIAAPQHRRKGFGENAVRAFLAFLRRHHGVILDEYARGLEESSTATGTDTSTSMVGNDSTRTANGFRLSRLVAKINAENTSSIRLFENLGFRRDGEPNYFNEVSMVLLDFLGIAAESENGMAEVSRIGYDGLGYRECFYDRS